MTTYLMQAMNAISESKIPKYWVGYFRENFRGELFDKLTEAFASSNITKAEIARKLDRRPEQITRWLSAPSNIESDTVADIAMAMGLVPVVRFERIADSKGHQDNDFVVSYNPPQTEDNTRRVYLYAIASESAAATIPGKPFDPNNLRLASAGSLIKEKQHA